MKDTTFKLRISKKLLEIWKKTAKKYNYESVSAFIRSSAMHNEIRLRKFGKKFPYLEDK